MNGIRVPFEDEMDGQLIERTLDTMETSQAMRGRILALHNLGCSKAEIARRLNISHNTVTRWINRYTMFLIGELYPTVIKCMKVYEA